jgi:hypothetical protein
MWLKSLVVAASLLGAGGAWAQSGTPQEQAACRSDVRKFCAQVTGSDNQKYQDCLQSHVKELSQKCQQVLMTHQGQ